MSEMHFIKFKETGDSRYVYQDKLDKACFQHDMAHGDFKNERYTHLLWITFGVLIM